MDDALRAAYRETAYQVRLPGGARVTLRVGEALPLQLYGLIGEQPWAFITAYHPRSRPCPPTLNRPAQHALLSELRAFPTNIILAGVGRGLAWREPSLFVAGLGTDALDALARLFDQNAYLHGQGGGQASLRFP